MEDGNFLNVKKSFIISSPAGSGKTEKLAGRYVALLSAGAEVERVLAITFTEKAASEMKQRILGILASEDRALYRGIKAKIPLMRISTIHAFCLRLLKRFSDELGLEPEASVIDEDYSKRLWQEAVSSAIRKEAQPGKGPFLFSAAMKEMGLRGWETLFLHLGELYLKRPVSELLLQEGTPPRRGTRGGEREARLLALYRAALGEYAALKRELRVMDFSDLELFAHDALHRSPEWQNILYCFDEHTDHILVDEFQDTSALQWKLLDTLTEEWRSGLGAKRESGTVPTVFLVGDEKQSIYLFRGADVSVVNKARKRLSSFLGPEYEFREITENYRSLPAIVDFINALFGKIMSSGGLLAEDWQVRYSPFRAVRTGEGSVRLLLMEESPEGAGVKENREHEADVLARYIKALAGSARIYSTDEPPELRPCAFGDMAVLLRQRTHLHAFETAFRRCGIPFAVLKGIGFYFEPEVALLREFISFIADPSDDYSLFCLLKSPLFGLGADALLKIHKKEGVPLLESLGKQKGKKEKAAFAKLLGLIELARKEPVSRVIEALLVLAGGWALFSEPQRHANVRRFITMIESLEREGLNPVSIRNRLIAERHKEEVPKANVNTEGMNAVKLMTVHAAKGLQFPVVFIPCLDEAISPRSSSTVIEETASGEFVLRYEPVSALRREIPEFERQKEKELEEEKRLFYVAATRARDILVLSGCPASEGKKNKNRMDYLEETFPGIRVAGAIKDGGENEKNLPFEVISEARVEELYSWAPGTAAAKNAGKDFPFMEPVYTGPIDYEPAVRLRDVTEDILVKTRHGKDWVIIGKLMHQLLDELSKGLLGPGEIARRAGLLVLGPDVYPDRREKFLKTILADMERLRRTGLMEEVVLPGAERSYSELSFVHERRGTIFKGRIDRLIVKKDGLFVYDYKCFPVKPPEKQELMEKYRFQTALYSEAASKMFALPARAFLVFTHTGECVEIQS